MARDYLYMIKEYISKGVMLPSDLLLNQDVYNLIQKSGKYPNISMDDLKEGVESLGITYDTLFISTNPTSPFVYIKDFTYIDIPTFDKKYLEMTNLKENIERFTETIDTLRMEEKYEDIITLTGNKYILNVFHEAYEEIPLQQKYKVFKSTYTKMEYGFQGFTPEILEEVLTLNTDTQFKEKLKVDEQGYVLIYRGAGTLSRGVEDSHSWTTQKEVAQFFANRFETNGNLYQAKIHIDDVIDFIEDRNENEILLNPEDVKDIIKLS